MEVRNLFQKLILVGGLFPPVSLFANNNENQNINRFECSSCHGATSPNLPADQGFSVVDPATNSAVTRYEPGKTYLLKIRFNNPSATGPWRNSYVLHIADITTADAVRAGSIINDGSIGLVTDTGPTNPQANSRIVNSAVKNSVDNPQLQWQAPNSGKVRFQLTRMETNNNNGQGGDRVSQTIEELIILPVGSTDTTSPTPTTGGTGTSGTDSGTDAGFQNNLAAGCGVLSGARTTSFLFLPFLLCLFVGWRRRLASNRRD